jgi:tetratricopeptide (TPR) repeat protein
MLPTGEFFRDVERVMAEFTDADRGKMQVLANDLGMMARAQATARLSDRCYALQARLYIKMRDYVLALTAVERALQMIPDQEEFLILRGDIHRLLQDYPQAVQDYSQALKVNDVAVTALARRAEVNLVELNNPQAALEDIAEALRHEPRSLRLIYLRAQALLKLQRPREAIADFLTVAQLCPKGETLRKEAKERLRELGVR